MAEQEKPPMAKPITTRRDKATPRGGFGLPKTTEPAEGISATINRLLGGAAEPLEPEYDQAVGSLRKEISSDFPVHPAPTAEAGAEQPDEQFDLTDGDLEGWKLEKNLKPEPLLKLAAEKSGIRKEPSYKFEMPEEGIEAAVLAAAEAATDADQRIEDEKTRERELSFEEGKISSAGDRITVKLPPETAGEDRIRSATQAGLSSIGAAIRKDKKGK